MPILGNYYACIRPKRSGTKFKGKVEKVLMYLSTSILSAS